MSEAFRKICLHHQALYEINNVTEFTSATKLRIKIKNYFKISSENNYVKEHNEKRE